MARGKQDWENELETSTMATPVEVDSESVLTVCVTDSGHDPFS